MGEISRKLHGKLKAMSLDTALPTSRKGRKRSPGTPDIAKLIAEGMDPVHATYVFIHYETGVSSSNLPMRTLKTGGHISTGGPDSVRLSLWDALVQSRSESVSDRDLA